MCIRDSGNFGAAQKDFEEFQSSMMTSAEAMMTRLDALWGKAAVPKLKETDGQAPGLDLNAGGAAAAQSAMDGEIKVLQQGLATKKVLLETELAQHKITKSQELQAEQDY